LIQGVHDAGALRDADHVRAWRARLDDVLVPASSSTELPEHDRDGDRTIDDVILQRGSTRLFRRDTAARDLLLWGLGVASRPVPGDVSGGGGTLLEHDVSVHAIDGVPSGLYRLLANELRAVRRGDTREIATRLCLDQPLGGDSAFTVFHASPIEPALHVTGSRGYRVAQFEGGVASGRLALAAFALGYGATGLTFYDDLVARVFETEALPMLATAVGVPDYRNQRGGRPGALAELARYPRLMQRLNAQLRAR
jgi:hypothetical protein